MVMVSHISSRSTIEGIFMSEKDNELLTFIELDKKWHNEDDLLRLKYLIDTSLDNLRKAKERFKEEKNE